MFVVIYQIFLIFQQASLGGSTFTVSGGNFLATWTVGQTRRLAPIKHCKSMELFSHSQVNQVNYFEPRQALI